MTNTRMSFYSCGSHAMRYHIMPISIGIVGDKIQAIDIINNSF
jgi:hypothetical protein